MGTYTITDLIPGTYTVKIEKTGFKSAVYRGVIVEAGGRKSTADVVLSAGGITESAEVNAEAITLETEQPELGATIERKALEELPAEIGGGVHSCSLRPEYRGGRSATASMAASILRTKSSSTESARFNRKRKDFNQTSIHRTRWSMSFAC